MLQRRIEQLPTLVIAEEETLTGPAELELLWDASLWGRWYGRWGDKITSSLSRLKLA